MAAAGPGRRNAGALAANSVWPSAPREGSWPGGRAALDPAPAEEGRAARGRIGLRARNGRARAAERRRRVGAAMWQRHEYLGGSIKVDRDWWIVTKLAVMPVICSLIMAGVFWLL